MKLVRFAGVSAILAAQSLFGGVVNQVFAQTGRSPDPLRPAPIFGPAIAGAGAALTQNAVPWSETLNQIPTADIVAILNSTNNAINSPVLRPIYQWYSLNREFLTPRRFEHRLAALSHAELRALLSDFLNASDTDAQQRATFSALWADSKKTLEDPDFLAAVQEISTHLFRQQGPARPYAEIFRIWRSNPLDRQAYIGALRTAEFAEFSVFLNQTYRVQPYEDLLEIVQAYLDPNRNRQYHHPLFIQAFTALRTHFPEGPLDRFPYLDVVFSVPIGVDGSTLERWEDFRDEFRKPDARLRFAATLKDRHDQWIRLRAMYDLPVEGPEDYEFFFESSSGVRARLQSAAEGGAVWTYYQEHYPLFLNAYSRLGYLFSPSGFYDARVRPLVELGGTITDVENVLHFFGTDLGAIELDLQAGDKRLFNAVRTGRLLESAAFHTFRDQIFKRYPEIVRQLAQGRFEDRGRKFRLIMSLLGSYENSHFEQLNAALDTWGTFPVPDFNTDNADLKIRILNIAQRLRSERSGLQISDPVGPQPGGLPEFNLFNDFQRRDQLILLAMLMESSRAQLLYRDLSEQWGLRHIELKDFLSVVYLPRLSGQFSDPENARKFHTLNERYHFTGYDNQNALTLVDLVHSADIALELYPLLTTDESSRQVTRYFNWLVSSAEQPGSVRLWTLSELAKFNVRLLRHPLFPRWTAALRQYNLRDSDIGFWLGRKDIETELTPDTIDALESEDVQAQYRALRAFYQHNYPALFQNHPSPDFRLFLRFYRMSADFNRMFALFPTLHRLGFNLDDSDTVDALQQELRLKTDLYGHLNDPRFIQFYVSVRERYYGNTRDVEALADFAELFDKANENPGKAEILLSTRMDPLLHFMRTRFGLAHLDPGTLVPLTQAAQGFDPGAVEQRIQRLEARGEMVNASDVILLTEIIRRPELAKSADDRGALERSVERLVYSRPAVRRSLSDHEIYWDSQRAKAYAEGQVDQIAQMDRDIQRFHTQYTERPPLRQLSSLQLLRLQLLAEALAASATLQELGRIISLDMADPTTEYGGIISFEGGKLRFTQEASYADNNAQFISGKYSFLPGGLMTFHLHAIDADASPYSGPSGWPNGIGGDMRYVSIYGLTDTVITPLGYALDANGRPDPSRLRVNIDVYTRDDIVDLGVYVVPVTPTPKRPTRSGAPFGMRQVPALFLAVLLGHALFSEAGSRLTPLTHAGLDLVGISLIYLSMFAVGKTVRTLIRFFARYFHALPTYRDAFFRSA